MAFVQNNDSDLTKDLPDPVVETDEPITPEDVIKQEEDYRRENHFGYSTRKL